jgi:hypothetical protein
VFSVAAFAARRPAPVIGPPAAAVIWEAAVVAAATASPHVVTTASGGGGGGLSRDRIADPAEAGLSFIPPSSWHAPFGG